MKTNRSISITIVCIILGILLATQYKSIYNIKKNASFENKRIEDVKDEYIREKRTNEDLKKRNEELEKQNLEFENIRGNDNNTVQILKKELEAARIIAGLTQVKGKGVVITINDSEVVKVEDIDILNVLNELRASDAQAISINDERIIATSEVREAGKYIMVNSRQMLAPFVIKAIADPEKLEHSLKMIGGVIEKLEVYQLEVAVEKSDNIMIPKVRDDGSVIKTDMLTSVK
jgi:uncharacterized protein YlxW (UPF0749 family)